MPGWVTGLVEPKQLYRKRGLIEFDAYRGRTVWPSRSAGTPENSRDSVFRPIIGDNLSVLLLYLFDFIFITNVIFSFITIRNKLSKI